MKTCRSLYALLGLVAAMPVTSVTAQQPSTTPTANATPTINTAPSTLKGTLFDGILVTVGDDIILLSDLQRAVRVASGGQTTLEPDGQLKGGSFGVSDAERLLEQLIDQRVLGLRVRELNINVSDEELEPEIAAFLKNQNLSQDTFMQMLKEEGETYENYRNEFRRQLETQRFVGRVIRPLVSVTEDELRNYYLQRSGSAERSQKVKLKSLMINTPAEHTDAQKNTKSETVAKIKSEASSGTDFGTLVTKYSESPDAEKTGGTLPPRSPNELPPEVWNEVKDAKVNAILGPFTIGSAVFFFQYLGHDLNNLADFEKQKPQLENQLLEVKFQERLNEYLKAERGKVKISKPNDFKFDK